MTATKGDQDRLVLPRPTTVELTVIGVLALLGLRIGLRPISDNSMLLHMRTGIDMVASGHIPHHDPYSFTAAGHTWVVQSWLAELTYGLAHSLAGYKAVVLEQGVLMALIGLATALLARTGKSVQTVVAATVSVLAGCFLWSPRPLLFGLLGMALLILIIERRWHPLWLLPVMWVWVNTHGSFPLGAAWVAARYVGAALDGRGRPRWLDRYVIAFVGALALAMINPFGPRLLAFPLVVQQDRKVFQAIAEWKSPNFQTGAVAACLVFWCVGLIILTRRRAPWGDVLPVVGFLAAGLLAERNLAVAAIVLAPALGRAMRDIEVRAVRLPTTRGGGRADGLPPVSLPALALAGIALVVIGWRSNPLDLKTYPTAGETYLAGAGLLTGHRIAAFDLVGDFRAFAEGAHHEVFIDDRYDMYPASVVADSQVLAGGQPPVLDVLKRRNIDVVLWKKGEGPTSLLHLAGGWRQVWSDPKFEILVRDPSAPPSPASGA